MRLSRTADVHGVAFLSHESTIFASLRGSIIRTFSPDLSPWSVRRARASVRQWQREEESTARADGALDPDAAIVSLDDAFGDRKAEPDAAAVSPAALPELTEHMGKLFGGNARTRVHDRHAPLVIGAGAADRDPAAA